MNFISGRQTRSDPAKAGEVARRHRPDYLIVLFMSMLLLLGLVVLFAISPARVELINATNKELNQNFFMYKQLLYLCIGFTAFAITASIPLRFWQQHQGKLLVGALGLSGLLAFLGLIGSPLALCTGGACRWYDLGIVAFQPAEVIKFALVIFLASFLAVRAQANKINNLHETLIPIGIILAVTAFLVIGVQKDMGTGITIFSIAATMLFVAGINARYFMLAGLASLGLGLLLIVTSPHRIERVVTFFAPHTNDPNNYHIQQALIAVGSGGLTGKGLGQSVQAFGYLPEAVNDSIFAILGEKFGFIGLLAVIAIFAALFMRLLKTMDGAPNMYYRLVVAGVFGWLASHTVVNIGAMLGIFPLTGITLPFLSYGGTSLLFTMCALGLVIHVSRYTTHQGYVSGGGDHEDSSSRRGIGRSRDAGTRRIKRA